MVQPPRQLKGFRKVVLAPGQRRRVRFRIDERALSYWNADADDWRVTRGCYRVMVGRSSRDIVHEATIAVRGASCTGAVARVPGPVCRNRRSVTPRLRVRRSSVRRVSVIVNGRRTRTLRGPRDRVRVRVTGLRRRSARIRLVIRTTAGKRVVRSRRVVRCPPS